MKNSKAKYIILVKPTNKITFNLTDVFQKKIIKYRPWFLIFGSSKLTKNSIRFFDKTTKTEVEVSREGEIRYEELINLEKEVDIIRTIAIICGILKLTKTVYYEQKQQNSKLELFLSIVNVKEREILRNEDLGVFGEFKFNEDNIELKDVFVLDKNFDAVSKVKSLALDFCKKADLPIDETLLENEIKNAIEILDNPLKLLQKNLNQQ